ncbi:MAG: hypothetical protein M5U01_38280 [Ardenticatenaceae bacterium]|nr:hypothetical protein [Ardenticatenaceae bacterium]HBY97628.1 hypothetical protein [Chloroflexota bacterium]
MRRRTLLATAGWLILASLTAAAGTGLTGRGKLSPVFAAHLDPATATPVASSTQGSMPTMPPMMTSMATGTQGAMPTMTPMMTPMATGTQAPMPTMTVMATPMMTTTPDPGAPPGGDATAPTGSLLANGGAPITTVPTIALTLTATDDPGGSGVAWMYIRESIWASDAGWRDPHTGGHGGGMRHRMGGWQAFASTVTWELSPSPGVKYITVWLADAAWNVSSPVTAMINLLSDGATIDHSQVHHYRWVLHAGESLTISVRPAAGDPDLYVWRPGNAAGPDWWSDAATGGERVALIAPQDGLYLAEVRGYSPAAYTLDVTSAPDTATDVPNWSKSMPRAPLVVDEPDNRAAPPPGFPLYLPWLMQAASQTTTTGGAP